MTDIDRRTFLAMLVSVPLLERLIEEMEEALIGSDLRKPFDIVLARRTGEWYAAYRGLSLN